MDLYKSSSAKQSNRIGDVSSFRSERTPTKEFDFSNEVYQNLKKNYEERLASLESTIKETYQTIQDDEIIQTMKMNQVSDDYRRQRVQEIVEDALMQEKEIQIDKLIQLNAYLKSELRKSEEESKRIKQVYQEETTKFQQSVEEFQSILEGEARQKSHYKQEAEALSSKLQSLIKQNDQILIEKENEFYKKAHRFQNELSHIKADLDAYKEKLNMEEQNSKLKDDFIKEMQNDIEIFRREYGQLEYNYNTMSTEHNLFKKKLIDSQEIQRQLENDLNTIRNRLREKEEENLELQGAVEIGQKEKLELVNKTEYISSQVKKIVESEQKTATEMAEELKKKYKEKIGELKRQIEEQTELIETLNSDNSSLKYQLEESKTSQERIVSQLQNDMKLIKTEWDKKCQEIDLNAQRNIAELKAKHQLQINQLQAEYQSLLDKRLTEIQQEAASQINKTKSIDMEIKAQLEGRLAQIEKDYILKTKHENILTTEILDLKTKYAQELKETEERYEKEFAQRLKELADKNKLEYETYISTIRAQKQTLEQELLKSKQENHRLLENYAEERDRIERMQSEIEVAERNRRVGELLEKIEESNQQVVKMRNLFEEEVRKQKRSEIDNQETRRKTDDAARRNEELGHTLNSLRNEITSLHDSKRSLEEKLEEMEHRVRNLTNENDHIKYNNGIAEKEKAELSRRVKELNEELSQESQKMLEAISNTKKEDGEKLDHEINEKMKVQTKLTQAEGRIRHLSNEMTEKDKKIVEHRNTISRLENFINELQAKILNIESEYAHKESSNRDLIKKIERIRTKHQEDLNKVKRFINVKLTNLRADINSLGTSCQLEFDLNKKATQSLMGEIIKHLKDRIFAVRQQGIDECVRNLEKQNDDFQIKLKEIEVTSMEERYHEQLKFEQEIKSNLHQIDSLNREIESRNEEIKSQIRMMEELNNKLFTIRGQLERVEKENSTLKQINVEKSEEFERLQGFVHKELKRIRDDSQNVMEETVTIVKEQHEKELKSLLQIIDQIRESNILRMQRVEEEINKTHLIYNNDMTQMKTVYEMKVSDLEKESSTIEAELRTKKRENSSMRLEIDNLKETLTRLKDEHQHAFATFEEKVENFKLLMKQDSDKYLSYKSQASSEIDKYKRELKELHRLLNEKTQKVEDLTRIKEEMKSDLDKYRQLLIQKDKLVEVQTRPTTDKVTRLRDKEIQELQGLLNKSLQTFGGSKSVRGDRTISFEADKKQWE